MSSFLTSSLPVSTSPVVVQAMFYEVPGDGNPTC